jgi:hypothetical protein
MSSNFTPFENTKRRNQPREMLMTAEYLVKQGLWQNSQTAARLGAVHSSLELSGLSDSEKLMLQNFSRWADFLTILPDRVIIGECKLRPKPGPIEALLTYQRLFLSDPKWKEHHHKEIELQFVYAIEDPVMIQIAREHNVKCIQYVPEWLGEYLTSLQPRERRAPLSPL